ncbi:MAG TPA: sigma 54-interacting transcriptional regulator [Burkholderiaceae bacterium]
MRLIGKSLAPEVVMREMLHLMSELLGLNRGRIVLADDAADDSRAALRGKRREAPGATARIHYAYGMTRDEIARGQYGHGEGITGRVLATGQPILVQDVHAESQFLGRSVRRDQLQRDGATFIALPIEVNHHTVGVLACHREPSRRRRFNDDIALMRILATLLGQILQLQALLQDKTRALEARNAMLNRALDAAAGRYGIIGTSPALLQALGELERVSQAQASVLLLGESGTGKELFARALHLASQRRDAPFIKVNCAAIPETLFESELFGYERGAFTGAAGARAGWFEQADRGTIFLDEIGEMPLPMQTKLLRTLQEGTVTRLGGKHEIRVDVRVVAATNRDLEAEAERGHFRRDLFYRLNVIPIQLPSLRERREDIRTLAVYFANRANQANQRNINLSPAAVERLENHPWPGNIRELTNVIERLVLLTDGTVVSAADVERFLPRGVPAAGAPQAPARSAPPPAAATPLVRDYAPVHSHSVQELQAALERHHGNQSRAAQAVGLTVRQFSYRLRKAGLR